MKKLLLPMLLALVSLPALGCTSIIVSGRATADGRPLMLKHRDTGQLDNAVGYFRGPVYSFIALVNAKTAFDGEVWTGTNEAGFSIMNTASYNIKDDDVPASEMDREGVLMYKALGCCAKLSDFECLLDTLSRPLGVEANFGVIDACGGAAYYEVNNHSWVKYDVNALPRGYRVVTNFSESGRPEDYRGVERYVTAEEIFAELLPSRPYRIGHREIFEKVSRSYRNKARGTAYVIPRSITSASLVIEGVAPGENPLHTVMWTILGYPPAGVAVPLLVGKSCLLPQYMQPLLEGGHAEMCDLARERKKALPSPEKIRAAEDRIESAFGAVYGKWISGQIGENAFYREYTLLHSSFWKWYLEF